MRAALEAVEGHPDGGIDAVLATFVVGMLEDPADAVDDWCDIVGSDGTVVLANAARSREWYAPPVNAVFRAIVVLSTPPTTRLRYESDPHIRLDEKIDAAHARLRASARSPWWTRPTSSASSA